MSAGGLFPRPESFELGNAPSPGSAAPAYIDLPALLGPDFDPCAHANSLVLATNNPDDPPPLDLSTPLSRILFDAQEIDSRIDSLATRHAVPLLAYTRDRAAASDRIVTVLDGHVRALNDGYAQLEKDVIGRHAEADEVRHVAGRVWEALRLARIVSRCLNLGRQLEVQFAELLGGGGAAADGDAKDRDRDDANHRALVRCAHTVLSLRDVLDKTAPGQEGHQLLRVDAIRLLSETVVQPTERAVRETSERIIREFSVSAAATFTQGEDTRSRTVSALVALYLLSPTAGIRPDRWGPTVLLVSLESYVRTAVQSSVAGLARGLGQLPLLERALAEVAGRCQNVVALEMVLEATKAPSHPLFPSSSPLSAPAPPLADQAADPADPADPAEPAPSLPHPARRNDHRHVHTPPPNLLQPLLSHLETGSLASFFWRTTAGGVSSRVQEIVSRGGVALRTLRTNKAAVGDVIRDAVRKGSSVPPSLAGLRKGGGGGGGSSSSRNSNSRGGADDEASKVKKWEMEMAVMVGSVVNNLGR